MQPARLLPIPPGTSFSQWSDKWLFDISADMQSVIQDDSDALRSRNERFSSYCVTLGILIAEFHLQIDQQKITYRREHPRPEKGITEWNEVFDLQVSPLRRQCEMLEQLHEDIARRLSGSQTSLRTIDSGVKHGV